MRAESNAREANVQAILSLKGQKLFKMDAGGGLLSCFGGLPVAAKILQDSGLLDLVDDNLDEWRTGIVDYEKKELLMQRLLLIASGNPDAIDCTYFGHDPALKASVSKVPDGPALASQSTHTRMEQEISEKAVEQLEGTFLEFFFQQHKHAPQKLGIAFDGTAIQTYGTQQGSTYRGHKKQEQFFPLVATTDDGWVLKSKLRYGKVSDANSYLDILEVVLAIKERWPRTKQTVRIDTAFNCPELLAVLEEEGISYQCGYKFSKAIETACRAQLNYDVFAEVEEEFVQRFGEPKFVGKQGKKEFQKEHTRIRELSKTARIQAENELARRRVRKVVEIQHRGSGWEEDKRVIVRVNFDDTGLDVRCVVTNDKCGLPSLIYENGYCLRSRVECWIKENKIQCRVPLSCQEFTANQFRFILQGLAYQLLHLLRLRLPRKKPLSIASIRNQLILIPVLIVPSARRIHWHLSTVHPGSQTLLQIAKKLA